MSGNVEYTVLLERRGYKDKPLYRGTNWNLACGLAEAYIGRGDMVRIEERAMVEIAKIPVTVQMGRAGK